MFPDFLRPFSRGTRTIQLRNVYVVLFPRSASLNGNRMAGSCVVTNCMQSRKAIRNALVVQFIPLAGMRMAYCRKYLHVTICPCEWCTFLMRKT